MLSSIFSKKRLGQSRLWPGLISLWLLCALSAGLAHAQPGEELITLGHGIAPEPERVIPPEYPLSARQRGVEGWVILAYDVDAEGRAVDIQAMDAIGSTNIQKSFEKAAISALQQWRFTPATIDGEPVRQSNMLRKFIFAMRDGNGGVTKRFRQAYSRAAEALDNGDLDEAAKRIGRLDDMQINVLAEYAYLELIKAMYWQKAGDERKSLEHVELGIKIADDVATRSVYTQFLWMAVVQNGYANNFHKALEYYETYREIVPDLDEDNAIHKTVRGIHEILAGDKAIITAGEVSACKLCKENAFRFNHELNRSRFSVQVDSGQIDKVSISCGPAHVSLAWRADTVWNLKNNPADCDVYIYGTPGAELRLIELPREEQMVESQAP